MTKFNKFKKIALFSSGTAVGAILGTAFGLVGGLALHEVIADEALERLKEAKKR